MVFGFIVLSGGFQAMAEEKDTGEPMSDNQFRIMSYSVGHSRTWDERGPLIQKQLESIPVIKQNED